MISKLIPICCCLLLPLTITRAAELHVAVTGDDANSGNPSAPLRTIQRAAELAQPGDRITVHEGVYRERVNPPRGGTSEDQRITYQAAPGEKVIVKGSEVVKGWQHTDHNVWRVQLPNTLFGAFNPFFDSIRGDWFNGRGRLHHTGAVYFNGTWLTEAASLDEVLMPPGTRPAWLSNPSPEYIINVAWLAAGDTSHLPIRIPAAEFSSQHGIQTAACSEGGECIGWIEHGDWTRYAAVDFGAGADRFVFRAAAPGQGGLIEVRLDGPEGQLLGVCRVRNTGDWQTWATFSTQLEQPIKGLQDLCLVFKALDADGGPQNAINPNLWFAQVDDNYTTLWAQFPEADPNQELVEVNVRQSVFYPDRPGRDFITVRGFTLQHAATPWAPPTAEQIGLIGTHWSRGWIIEDNTITHSVCTGITLGKHGDQYDNTSADTAEGYVKTIERAHAFPIPWTRDHVGGHLVRNNTIAYCEQAGIVGSMGAAFSRIEGNHIHDIHVRRLFTGAEMAGIKFHGAIDTTIEGNHIHHTVLGLWLDWMTQGTRVTRNLFYDNISEDLFVEVNHGPFLVDNNLFLSRVSLLDMSEGGAYVHNLFGGLLTNRPEPSRETPFHPANSTLVAGLATTTGGDNRFYNNVFIGDGRTRTQAEKGDLTELRWISSHGLWGYDGREFPIHAAGNLYLNGAEPSRREPNPILLPDLDPGIRLQTEGARVQLQYALPADLNLPETQAVTSELLGRAKVSNQPYLLANGTKLHIKTDYFQQPPPTTIDATRPSEPRHRG